MAGLKSDDYIESDDEWYRELSRLCAKNDEENDALLKAAIEQHQREAKEMMRREMGIG